MPRIFSNVIITFYLGVLLLGVGAHAIQYRQHSHPLTYFVVWDMFSGWSGWEQRTHIIGEGESGQMYDLGRGPWEQFHPYSNLGRRHYDPYGNHAQRIALNTLTQTDHEKIEHIYVVEESWPKKFNLSDAQRQSLNLKADQKKSQFIVRSVALPNGRVVTRRASFFSTLANRYLSDNPRLHRQARLGKPSIAVSRNHPARMQ